MAFERVKSMKGGRGTRYGSIDKTGRLIIPHAVCALFDGKPGMYFELLVDRDESLILLRPQEYETAYSVKSTCTGKLAAWNDKSQAHGGRTPNLIVSVKTALSMVGLSIVSRLRVACDWSADLDGLVVHLPKPEIVTSEIARISAFEEKN